MPPNTDALIADALRRCLEAQIRARPGPRAFFRVSDFSTDTYIALLDDLRTRDLQLAGRRLEVRTIAEVSGHADRLLGADRSPTWYRNNLAPNHALVLIQNRRTSDAQSLQDIYPVTALSLSTDGLVELIDACITSYQLAPKEQRQLSEFVRRLTRVLYQPQLRDLAEFLAEIDSVLHQQAGTPLDEAIARALPQLGLFRCRDLIGQLNSTRCDKILRQLQAAARIGSEVLDERTREAYLRRLEGASLDNDEVLGGASTEQKRILLERFIEGQLRDSRAELLQVLQIDWREIQKVITAKSRATQQEKLVRIAENLEKTLQDADPDDDLREVLTDLRDGETPDASTIDRLLADRGDTLAKALRNDLRRLVKTRIRRHADFLVGLTALAVELVQPQRAELAGQAHLRVTPRLNIIGDNKHLPNALEVFQILYGGIEQIVPSVSWELEELWRKASVQSNEQSEDEEDAERERVIRVELPFRITLLGPDGKELAQAELIWQYRSDSPASATAQTLAAERAALRSDDYGPLFGEATKQLRIPVFNGCPVGDEIGDLDIHRPIQALGAWFEQPDDLRKMLEAHMQGRIRPTTQAALSESLDTLEQAWAALVDMAGEQGLFSANISEFITAYDDLLTTATTHLQSGQEVSVGYRAINQAWMIGPPDFDSWAVMPLLHPLKMLWWYERARYFNEIITHLLDPGRPLSVVDEPRYLRELAATYGSSQFPPLLALPPGDGRPAERFLPAEEAEGYELYVREAVVAEAFGLDTDLLAEDENEKAAQQAVEGIAAVIQDYVETYPFVRDGVEIVIFECRNGALPGLLVERLTRIGERRGWTLRLSVIVHTSSRGAPLFRRVSEWVQNERTHVSRQSNEYFPPISLKVIEGPYEELLQGREDTDLVILADVLADKGQHVVSKLLPAATDVPLTGYLPTYRAQQEPFQRGELHRQLLLTPPQQPAVVRRFLLAQHAAVERRVVKPNQAAHFYRELTIDAWEQVLGDLHDQFNWVICYDPTIDRFLMESVFPDKVQIIRYSLGLGAKRQHNLTVSSSRKAQDVVVRRLAGRLGQMFHRATPEFLREVAEQLVTQAKQVSGDIVLRAAGPGAFLNELIGLVVARFETERRLQAAYPDALISWVLLDDFEHWFSGGKFPDLLCVAMTRTSEGKLGLHTEVIEAKCVGQPSFDAEAQDAQRQVLQGVGRLAYAFAAGSEHLDALYWYDQLYRSVIGNLQVELEQQELWELFRTHLHSGTFQFEMEGHSWAFCYDGRVAEDDGPNEHDFALPVGQLEHIKLRAHHYGRNELCQALRELVEAAGEQVYAPELWEPTPDDIVPEAATPEPLGELPTAAPQVEEPVKEATVAAVNRSASPKVSSLPTSQPVPTTEPEPNPEQAWVEQKARELERALRQRGIQIFLLDPAQADVGPSIVRFKLRLRPTESLKKIQSISEDLARDLALPSTPLIDNVLRTNFVGVDIPREQATTIELRPLLDGLGTPGPAELPIIVGVTPDGTLISEDLSEFPHLLVAGATNSGKSVFLRSLLLSLMTQYQPGELELLIVDPKRTDFTFFNNLPYLRGSKVLIERNEARDALLELVRNEMPRRQNLIANRSMKVKVFNQRFPSEALPPIVALIDEYALLVSMMDKKEREAFEQDLMILAAAARSVGIHLVLATQRPSADIVTSTLKANLDARIAFRVASNTNSRVVLDTTGAENLLGRGDMLFRRPSGEIIRLQAPFMDEVSMQQYIADLQQPV
jgi:hypothetical protein